MLLPQLPAWLWEQAKSPILLTQTRSPEVRQAPGEGGMTSVPEEGQKHLGGSGSPGENHNASQAGWGMGSPNCSLESLQSGLDPTRAKSRLVRLGGAQQLQPSFTPHR